MRAGPKGRGCGIAIVLAGLATACANPMGPSEPEPPSFVFIVADDLDAASPRFMPHLNALLVDRGVTFRNSFVTTPLCAPSRASLLRGQYAHNHGVLHNFLEGTSAFERFRDLGREGSTLATWLDGAGYHTAMVGKYVNRYPGDRPGADPTYVPPGWDDWYAVFSDRGSDAYYDYSLNENRRIVPYASRPEDYMTDVLARKTLDAIKHAGSSPFYVWLSPSAPHRPAVPAPRHAGALANEIAPRTASFNEADMSDKPAWFRDPAHLPLLTESTIRGVDDRYRNRLRTMLAVDEAIDEIVRTLEASGRLKNTYLIFTSDNGFQQGQHRFQQGKDTVYEVSIRVPLVIRGPNVPEGRVLDHMVTNVDLAPTLAELAGVPVPPFVEGWSLARLLRGNPPPTRDWRRDILVEHWADSAETFPSYAAVRSSDAVYVEYDSGEREFYDLVNDADQIESLHNRVAPSMLAPYAERLRAIRNCQTTACP